MAIVHIATLNDSTPGVCYWATDGLLLGLSYVALPIISFI